LEYLHEDTIKRATLAFMKTYYKFRPRTGETVIRYDMMHPSGVIVDGHLTFPKEDGSTFIATFEATSTSTAPEIRFRLQRRQLLWDAFACGSGVAAVFTLALYLAGLWSVLQLGWVFSAAMTLAVMFLGFLAFHLFRRSAERYRYIYAIEQFKQYHADEQWVSIGNDIFSSSSDPNFVELRTQCVKYGFGLVTVDHDEHVNLLITPAREEVFGKKRRDLKFVEAPSVNETPLGIPRLSSRSLDRFQRPYLGQLTGVAASLLILAGIFYRSWSENPVETVSNAENYRQEMEKTAGTMQPEDSGMVINPDDVEKNASAKPYMPPATAISDPPKTQPQIGLYVYSMADGQYIAYDCARVGMSGQRYVVQDLLFADFDMAQQRIEKLKTYGLIANAVSLACTKNAKSTGYCVYYEAIFSDVKVANAKAVKIKNELTNLGLTNDFIQLRILDFE
jgi:hypothetical protein